MDRAKLLFGCYRRAEANDPETYVAAITAVLCEYPADVVRSVTDPSRGLPRKLKWAPSVQEVAEACEEEMAHLDRIKKGQQTTAASSISWQQRRPVVRANLFVSSDRARYPEMLAKAEKSDKTDFIYSHEPPGIWVPINWFL